MPAPLVGIAMKIEEHVIHHHATCVIHGLHELWIAQCGSAFLKTRECVHFHLVVSSFIWR